MGEYKITFRFLCVPKDHPTPNMTIFIHGTNMNDAFEQFLRNSKIQEYKRVGNSYTVYKEFRLPVGQFDILEYETYGGNETCHLKP